MGLFLTCGGKFSIPLEWEWVSGETSVASKSLSSTLSSSKGEVGLSLEMLQRQLACSIVQGRIS